MIFQQLLNGIMLGGTYALLALGYTLIFGILRVLHIAHGEVFMVGALVGLNLVLLAGVNIYVALLGGLVGAAVVGVVVEQVSIRPLYTEGRSLPHLAPLLSTLGAGLILQDLAVKYYGGRQVRFPETVEILTYHIGSVVVTSVQLVIIATSLILMVALNLFLRSNFMGKAMRAVAENARTASLLGVDVNRVILLTFAIASALAGAAGVLVGLAYGAISPFMGVEIGLKGFAIIVIGGMGSIVGAMVGGLAIGLVEVLSVGYLASSYRDAFAFGFMVLILLLRPQGLFGVKSYEG
ncbi:MAG: branched-chain amino acid ABC transporter permease [Candidatus Methylomirabilia bacterium]